MEKKRELEIEVPEGVEVEIVDNQVIVKNDSGQVTRKFSSFHVDMEKKDNRIILSSKASNKRVKSLVGTARGDLSNMIKGVTEGVSYKLKILYSHFPMNVKVQGQNVIIENFIGEKYPRKSRILDGVNVEINGQDITVSGIDKENVAQSAANLEQATKISKLDPRVFQDGIYIVEKDGKQIS
ncbi:MAG: 50S ribosomal protein L6 [Candidatus Altiarchaeales archaeon ex4484_2]|nr:MAG: 50S ribosomal protein L6 [Candidatus Altiarchaeales archaeon ex4484_2]